jgi:hypothetical protein
MCILTLIIAIFEFARGNALVNNSMQRNNFAALNIYIKVVFLNF